MSVPIVHHQRRPGVSQISIERLFEAIRSELDESFEVTVATSRQASRGLWPRLRNLLQAARQRGEIHHVVGDVHYLVFGLPRMRTVLTIHDCAALERLSGWRRALLKYFWFSGPIRRAAVVTTISQTTKDELHKWVGALADKVVVIPNCVRAEFTPHPKEFNAAAPRVLQVGTGWNKNLLRVAEALQGTPCELAIVGLVSPSQRAALDATGVPFRELGRLSDEDLVAAYRAADLVVFASLYEGFGLPILEAHATGRPVITSNRSSMPEAAGTGALLVDPESVAAIHAALQQVVGSAKLRDELVANGFANVARFRPRAIAASYATVYHQMLNPS